MCVPFVDARLVTRKRAPWSLNPSRCRREIIRSVSRSSHAALPDEDARGLHAAEHGALAALGAGDDQREGGRQAAARSTFFASTVST